MGDIGGQGARRAAGGRARVRSLLTLLVVAFVVACLPARFAPAAPQDSASFAVPVAAHAHVAGADRGERDTPLLRHSAFEEASRRPCGRPMVPPAPVAAPLRVTVAILPLPTLSRLAAITTSLPEAFDDTTDLPDPARALRRGRAPPRA